MGFFDYAEQSQQLFWLTVGILIPLIGRTIYDLLLTKAYQQVTTCICKGDPVAACCDPTEGRDDDYSRLNIQGVNPDEVTIQNIAGGSISSWTDAREKLGWNPAMAVSVSVLRLIFWHLMQPVAYCFTLYSFANEVRRPSL